MKIRVALFAALMASTALPALATDTAVKLETARKAMRQGDSRAALILLRNAVKDDPKNGEARFELGMLDFAMHDLPGAEKELRQARESGFDPARVTPALAAIYLAQGKNRQVLSDVPPCPTDTRCQATLLAARARALLALNKPTEAVAEAEAAVQAAPDHPDAQVARALSALAVNDMARAESALTAALTANPNHGEALAARADLLGRKGDMDGAIAALRSALAQSPGNAQATQKLALALVSQDHDDEARPLADEALKLAPDNAPAVYTKALILARAGQMEQAVELARPAEAEMSKLPAGNYLLASIHAANGNLQRAAEAIDRFNTATPGTMAGAKLAGRIYLLRGEADRVVTLLEPLRPRVDDDAEALALLRAALMAEGRGAEAEALPKPEKSRNAALEVASSATLDSPATRYVAAVNQTMAGDEENGRAGFQAIIDSAPSFLPATAALSELDMRTGRAPQARARLDEFIKRWPKDNRALVARARLELRDERPAQAVPFLERAVAGASEQFTPRMMLVESLLAANEKSKAKSAAMDLLRVQPRNPAALDLLARVQLAQGKREEALSTYRQLMGLTHDRAILHHRIAQILTSLNKLPEAKTELDKALALDGKGLQTWRDRLELERRISGLDAALKLAQSVPAKLPNEPALTLLEGDVLAAADRLDDARKSWTEAQSRQPSSSGMQRLFVVAGSNPPLSQARDWLERNPDDDDVRRLLADHLTATGDYKGAAMQYEKLAAHLPMSPAFHNNLAWIYQRLGDKRALGAARQAFHLAPTSPEVMDTYAMQLAESGDSRRAAELLTQAHTRAPFNPAISFHLARLLAERNDNDAARALLKPIMESKTVFDEAEDARKLYRVLGGA